MTNDTGAQSSLLRWSLLLSFLLLVTACSSWQPKAEPKKTPEEALKERVLEELLDLKGKRKPPSLPEPSTNTPARRPVPTSPTMLAFEQELQRIIDRAPKYVWGGSTDEAKGLDCSGYLFLAARRAGAPVRRTTALRMAQGESGWQGAAIQRGKHRALDLVWWSWKDKPGRPYGHVGAFWKTPQQVTHASSAYGRVVIAAVIGKLDTDMSLIKRMNW